MGKIKSVRIDVVALEEKILNWVMQQVGNEHRDIRNTERREALVQFIKNKKCS